MNKELKALLKDAKKRGARVQYRKHGYVIMTDNATVAVSSTPRSDHSGAYRTARRRLGL